MVSEPPAHAIDSGLDFALELALRGPSLSGMPLLLETQILKNYSSTTWLWLVLSFGSILVQDLGICVSVVLPISRILLDYVKWPYQLEFSLGIQQGDMDNRWPTRRLEFAADVIVNTLQEKKESGHRGLTRQDV
ncbi:hypothetical protein PS2_017071 [Malus domestica]